MLNHFLHPSLLFHPFPAPSRNHIDQITPTIARACLSYTSLLFVKRTWTKEEDELKKGEGKGETGEGGSDIVTGTMLEGREGGKKGKSCREGKKGGVDKEIEVKGNEGKGRRDERKVGMIKETSDGMTETVLERRQEEGREGDRKGGVDRCTTDIRRNGDKGGLRE